MIIIEGVGNEIIYAALFAAAPIAIIIQSSWRSHTLYRLKQGFSAVGKWVGRAWNIMWSRNNSMTASEINVVSHTDSVSPPQNDCCPICHDPFHLPCQANCAHWFCGDCILQVWQYTLALQPCRCPICRRPINLLIPSDFDQNEEPETQIILQELANYNRIHGGVSVGIVQRVRDMPLLLRRMVEDLMDPQRGLPLLHRARIIIYLLLLVCYVFSPFDILPEGILGIIGLFDDLLMMLFVLFHVATMYRTALVYRYALHR